MVLSNMSGKAATGCALWLPNVSLEYISSEITTKSCLIANFDNLTTSS